MKKINIKIKKYSSYILVGMMLISIITLFILLFKEKKSYGIELENKYNMAFYQLVDNVQDIEVYLSKAMISNSPKSGTETLTYVWREANLAESYLSMLPISSSEIENTSKFLNQVSDYCYSLSRKTMKGEMLTQEDLDNIERLHDYSSKLKETLNELALDINLGKVSWGDFSNGDMKDISNNSFTVIEENLHEYAGLIYDGAFSEHMTNPEHKGLIGEDIDEQTAKNIVLTTIESKDVKSINYSGLTESANIESYDYTVERNDGSLWWISVTKKGGHILYVNSNRDVKDEKINDDEADKNAKEFMKKNGYSNMKKTYYSKNGGIETINYAYEQDGVVIYPDLIKVKVALDNGEILGIETTGYLNSHTIRDIPEARISKDDAISKINSKLDILSIGMAIIPTEFQTEITCWEIKGKVNEKDFLVYINCETGDEEDILMILNSSEGTLTM